MNSKIIKREKYHIKLKNKLFEYIKTSRLSSWMTASVFFLIGIWYSQNQIPFYESIIALLSLGAILSAASWINFVCDIELDSKAGQDISFFENIPPKEMIIVSMFLFFIGLALLLFLNYFAFFVGLSIVIVSIIYSAKPIRLKIHPPFDSLSNALLFGTLPVMLGFSLNENFLSNQIFYALLLVGGLIIICYYLLIDIFDIETDKDFGIKTSCSILGLKWAVNVALILYVFTLLIAIIFFGIFSPLPLSLIICSPFILFLKVKDDFDSIRKILSLVSLIWVEIVLGYLFVLTNSVISLIILVLVALSALYFTYIYFFIIKKSRIEELH